ncbi:MAG: HU family DNA-binding protein [Gemmataceae bacterium]|nr:HU family DNA-binding protein [Gemmataceae bacterium]
MAKAAGKPAKKAMTKSAFVAELAEKTELSKKQVDAVLEGVVDIVQAQLKKGVKFTLPGLARLSVTKKGAVKGGVEKTNPLNGQKYVTKDKPASVRVSMRPVKALKEALN